MHILVDVVSYKVCFRNVQFSGLHIISGISGFVGSSGNCIVSFQVCHLSPVERELRYFLDFMNFFLKS